MFFASKIGPTNMSGIQWSMRHSHSLRNLGIISVVSFAAIESNSINVHRRVMVFDLHFIERRTIGFDWQQNERIKKKKTTKFVSSIILWSSLWMPNFGQKEETDEIKLQTAGPNLCSAHNCRGKLHYDGFKRKLVQTHE
jgi:hypothetical protein